MNQFVWGAIMMACCVIGSFFMKFWRDTGDRFFVIFSLAFWIIAIERIVLAYGHVNSESGTYVYLLRLAAFLFIIAAIVDKNRGSGRA